MRYFRWPLTAPWCGAPRKAKRGPAPFEKAREQRRVRPTREAQRENNPAAGRPWIWQTYWPGACSRPPKSCECEPPAVRRAEAAKLAGAGSKSCISLLSQGLNDSSRRFPPARGRTVGAEGQGGHWSVCPARAGMNRHQPFSCRRPLSVPRPCGDEPLHICNRRR